MLQVALHPWLRYQQGGPWMLTWCWAALLRGPLELGGLFAALAHHNVIHLLFELVVVCERHAGVPAQDPLCLQPAGQPSALRKT